MSLVVTRRDSALWLTLDRPEAFNALDGEMVLGVIEQLRAAQSDDAVRVVVITGNGDAFSAGADLSGERPAEKYDGDSADAAALMVRTLLDCATPVVIGLNGVAAGVGLSLAIAGDLIVARESAALTLGFSRIGLMPDGLATATVAAAVGRATAMRLALTSDLLSAKEALAAGLVTHVFSDEEWAEQLEAIVRRLSHGAPLALTATKRAINAAALPDLDQVTARERSGQAVLLRTSDTHEGMRAFIEGRRPTFRGE